MTHYSTDSRPSKLLTILSFNQHNDSYLPVKLCVEVLFLRPLTPTRDYRALLNLQPQGGAEFGGGGGGDCQVWKIGW